MKLAHALDVFRVDPTDRVCLDVGASTGGFTDVLLARGARRVYAVDVGYGQLHARLRGDPSLARNAFEEAIRYESPVQTFFRTTTREVELAGHRIGEGEKVLMFLGAANRDPRRWENPDSYDVTRRTSGHVGFGSGIHMCVGQLLARVEGEVMLAAIARKVASIEITGPVKRRYNNTLRGLESLPITISPA